MYIAVGFVELNTEDAVSLKEKRNILRSIKQRVRTVFNVSVAEVADQDRIASGVLGYTAVSGDRQYLEGLARKMTDFLDEKFPGRISHEQLKIEHYPFS